MGIQNSNPKSEIFGNPGRKFWESQDKFWEFWKEFFWDPKREFLGKPGRILRRILGISRGILGGILGIQNLNTNPGIFGILGGSFENSRREILGIPRGISGRNFGNSEEISGSWEGILGGNFEEILGILREF